MRPACPNESDHCRDLASAQRRIAMLEDKLAQAAGDAYRGLFENLGVGVFRLTMAGQGRFLQANPALAALLGYDSAEELMSTPVSQVYPDQRERAFFARQVLQNGFVADFELPLCRKDGRTIWAEASAAAQRDAEGRLLWIDGILTDVSQRRQAAEALRQSEQRFRGLSENAPDIIYTLSPDGRFTYVNRAWRRILGHAAEEVLGRYFIEFAPPDSVDDYRRLFKAVRDGKKTLYGAHPMLHKNGEVRHLAMSGAPNIDDMGRVTGMVGMLKDMSSQIQAERALRHSEASLARAQKLAGLGNWELKLSNSRLSCSDEVFNIYDLPRRDPASLFGEIVSCMHDDDIDYVTRCFEKAFLQDEAVSFEHRIKRHDGQERVLRQVASVLRDDRGEPISMIGAVQDITGIRASEEQMRLLARVFENTVEGIIVTDADGVIEMVNAAFCAITGFDAAEAVGARPSILSSGRHDAEFYQRMWRSLADQGHWQGEVWNRRKNGEAYPEWLTITAIKDKSDRTTHLVGVFHDITEAKRNEERITHQAYHDALTGLPNRQLFNDRLAMAIAQAHRGGHGLALLFLDLDNFKNINDSLGHAVGDMLLQAVAQRLTRWLREEDTVARLGGDEFVMLIQGASDPDYIMQVARRILDSMSQPFAVGPHELYVTASIGVTIHPHDGHDAQTLVANADLAMFRAKDEGRNNIKLFTPAMNAKVMRRMELEANLRKALEREEFEVFYQPKVELRSDKVVGVEALVRWRRPDSVVVSPDEFIPICEETGLILPLGKWVLEQACSRAKYWHDMGFDGLNVSVNLSPRQFQDNHLVDHVGEILAQTGLAPHCLELEITEGVVMHSVDEAIETMNRLSSMGVRLSLDDFGRGYSSLYYLKRFPMSSLKIDRSFVADIATDPDDASIVNTIISMSRSLNLQVVAEGVETKEQLDFLRSKRCDQMQGYYFSRPLPARELTELLEGLRPAV
ncbi:diguanylate cyclase/phosphodiesterase with PAS/PAC sensor(s) [Desulfarculus baarsii DSM 2075]|uniref:Diguanylate cyclase/phosphodiesterase with PAS/PAC sensor(S) n=1 Tax=Desulfarculus baarsii (strain ATCC 33931 / DSM 2075 / LMG 7858 / VKM B-1802 / 2st14) TaxID=644282 RepID=E1QF27_DESB2|nr:EAL domain-containing protein [Desulfarculus baarsii]ADK84163.1 diguanylate cyclase/phosphodiesterase with PAS/PAC sensor(s) [Desulfarculus baarsii DSM 2075]